MCAEPSAPWPHPDPAEPAPRRPSGSAGRAAGPLLQDLRIGDRLPTDLYDSQQRLLLCAGTQITREMLASLAHWSLTEGPAAAEPAPAGDPRLQQLALIVAFRTELTDSLDRITEAGEPAQPMPTGTALGFGRPQPLGPAWKAATDSRQQQQTVVAGRFEGLAESVVRGAAGVTDEARSLVAEILGRIESDADLLLALAPLSRPQNEYLFLHAANTCMLSLLLARHAGYAGDGLIVLGLAALLHDLGMLKIPADIRLAPRPLRADELYEVMKHPIHSVDMLESCRGIPDDVWITIYQVHERGDRNGYPRRRSPNLVHGFAKLIAAADSYTAMVAPRPWRSPKAGYEAMIELLTETKTGQHDAGPIRSLLQRLGLYPTGLEVELDNGATCIVRRANPADHARPVVEVVAAADATQVGGIIDLTARPQLQITRYASPQPN